MSKHEPCPSQPFQSPPQPLLNNPDHFKTEQDSRECAAIKIQSFWRRYLAEQSYNFQIIVLFIQKTRHLAALEIQRRWRGNQTRTIVDQQFNHLVITYPSEDPSIEHVKLHVKRPSDSLFSTLSMHYCPWRKCFVSIFPHEEGEVFFKFYVDGMWVLHPNTLIPVKQDDQGHANNTLTLEKLNREKNWGPYQALLRLRNFFTTLQKSYTQTTHVSPSNPLDHSTHKVTPADKGFLYNELDKHSSSSNPDFLSNRNQALTHFDSSLSSSTSINSDETEMIDQKSLNNTFLPPLSEKSEDESYIKQENLKQVTLQMELEPFRKTLKSSSRQASMPRASSSPIHSTHLSYQGFYESTIPTSHISTSPTPRRYAHDDQIMPFASLTHSFTNKPLSSHPALFKSSTHHSTDWLMNGHLSHTQDPHTLKDTFLLCTINRSASYSEHPCRVGWSVNPWEESFSSTNWLSS